MQHPVLSLVLWDDLEGWDGAGGGREVQRGRRYMYTDESLHCITETHTTLQSNYTATLKII